MVVHDKSRRHQLVHSGRTPVEIIYSTTCTTVEMMMMRLTSLLVPLRFARHIHSDQPLFFDQRFHAAIHRRHSKIWHDALRTSQDFFRTQRAVGIQKHFSNRAPLRSISNHRHITTSKPSKSILILKPSSRGGDSRRGNFATCEIWRSTFLHLHSHSKCLGKFLDLLRRRRFPKFDLVSVRVNEPTESPIFRLFDFTGDRCPAFLNLLECLVDIVNHQVEHERLR